MNNPVTLLVWRDAKTDPPERGRMVGSWADEGLFWYEYGEWWHNDPLGVDNPRNPRTPPMLWADAAQPNLDNPLDVLTVEDVDLICYWVETMSKVISGLNPGLAGPTEAQEALTSAVARLRAALDAMEGDEES